MFILWGTHVRDDVLGKVIDSCPVCDGVREFLVREHYRVPHLYGVPLRRWELVASTRTCAVCEHQFLCSPARYDRIVPVEIAKTLGFSDLLKQTNAPLAMHFEAAALLEINKAQKSTSPATDVFDADATSGRSVRVATPAEYTELQRLLDILDQHKGGKKDAAALFDELQNWSYLTSTQKRRLEERVADFATQQARAVKALRFLCDLTKQWPQSIGMVRSMLLVGFFCSLLACLAFVWRFKLIPEEHMGGVGMIVVLVVLVAMIVGLKQLLYSARMSWLREHLQTCPGYEDVDPGAIEDILHSPVNRDWDQGTIWSIIAVRPFREEIARQLPEPSRPE
jgi:hypothetical protein